MSDSLIHVVYLSFQKPAVIKANSLSMESLYGNDNYSTSKDNILKLTLTCVYTCSSTEL